MLPDSPDVEQVVLGKGGVLESARPGTRLIDVGTIRPEVSVRVAEAARQRGLRAVDGPVSGGEPGAIEGTPSIMVGGEEADAAARPILEAVGSTVVHVGPAGSGQTVKAANQLVVAGTIQLVAEALVFLEAHGVNTHAAREVGVAIPLGVLVAQLRGALRAQGHGSLDHSALLLLVEQRSCPAGEPPGS